MHSRTFENNEAEAGDEFLSVAYAIASNNLFVGLEHGEWKRNSNLTSVVVHIEKLLAVAIVEGNALDRVSLSLSAASLKLLALRDDTCVHSNADLGQVACRESRRADLIFMEELNSTHADCVRVFEPEADTFKWLDHRCVFRVWPGKVDVFICDI